MRSRAVAGFATVAFAILAGHRATHGDWPAAAVAALASALFAWQVIRRP